MKTINEQIEEIIISTVGVSLEGEYPYKIKLTNVDQAAKEIIALKQQAEKTPAQELSNNRQQSEDSANNLKTAEEILKGEMSENLWTFICSYPVSYKSEEKLVEWIIDAMQEYAAQFKAEKEKPIINLINNIECFAQILGKHCVDKKVSLTSNERHTIYDAFKEYIFQIEAEQEVTDADIAKWADMVQPVRGGYKADYIFAAKAMRDGKIKAHKDNLIKKG